MPSPRQNVLVVAPVPELRWLVEQRGEPSTIGVVWQLESIFYVLNFTLNFLEAGFFLGVVIILNFLLKIILLLWSLDSEGNFRDFKKQFRSDFRKNTEKKGECV